MTFKIAPLFPAAGFFPIALPSLAGFPPAQKILRSLSKSAFFQFFHFSKSLQLPLLFVMGGWGEEFVMRPCEKQVTSFSPGLAYLDLVSQYFPQANETRTV